MKARTLGFIVLATLVLIVSCHSTAQAESQATPPVEVNKTYKVLVGMGALSLTVLEIGKGGLVKVQVAEDASFLGIQKGKIFWLNLNQALLVEAK